MGHRHSESFWTKQRWSGKLRCAWETRSKGYQPPPQQHRFAHFLAKCGVQAAVNICLQTNDWLFPTVLITAEISRSVGGEFEAVTQQLLSQLRCDLERRGPTV